MRKTALERFASRVTRTESGCWVWGGALSSGYGKLRVNGKAMYAHRFAYEEFRHPIPDGLELDHLCRNTQCVNPFHTQPVTHTINVGRGNWPSAINSRKTHCKRGHLLQGDNLIIMKRGRQCRTCVNRNQMLARYRRRK